MDDAYTAVDCDRILLPSWFCNGCKLWYIHVHCRVVLTVCQYEWTTRALGMVHYGFWNDKYFTSPQLPPKGYPECFQGNAIPIDGDAVPRLVESRLSLDEETDD